MIADRYQSGMGPAEIAEIAEIADLAPGSVRRILSRAGVIVTRPGDQDQPRRKSPLRIGFSEIPEKT